MTAVRIVYYVTDPFLDVRQPIAALVAAEGGVVLVRAPRPDIPDAARANVNRVLRDLEDAEALDPLPFGTGAQVVGGTLLVAPVAAVDAPAWALQALAYRAA